MIFFQEACNLFSCHVTNIFRFPSQLVAKIALSYHNQVNLDFHCFEEYVKRTFPSTSS